MFLIYVARVRDNRKVRVYCRGLKRGKGKTKGRQRERENIKGEEGKVMHEESFLFSEMLIGYNELCSWTLANRTLTAGTNIQYGSATL